MLHLLVRGASRRSELSFPRSSLLLKNLRPFQPPDAAEAKKAQGGTCRESAVWLVGSPLLP